MIGSGMPSSFSAPASLETKKF